MIVRSVTKKPWVTAVMLANGRPAMVRRAIESFARQTYENRRLLVWDTTPDDSLRSTLDPCEDLGMLVAPIVSREAFVGVCMGLLRNAANKYAVAHYEESWKRPTLLAHWDSDDWSHPYRLEEQIEFIEHLGTEAHVVGYRDMLFWDTRTEPRALLFSHPNPRYILGSSMLYRASSWEARRFDERDPKHEDHHWWQLEASWAYAGTSIPSDGDPRMICSLHGGNTSEGYTEERMRPPSWIPISGWDAHCRKVMKL